MWIEKRRTIQLHSPHMVRSQESVIQFLRQYICSKGWETSILLPTIKLQQRFQSVIPQIRSYLFLTAWDNSHSPPPLAMSIDGAHRIGQRAQFRGDEPTFNIWSVIWFDIQICQCGRMLHELYSAASQFSVKFAASVGPTATQSVVRWYSCSSCHWFCHVWITAVRL